MSLSLFNTLQSPFFMLPYGVVCIIQGAVSIGRINDFLNTEEIDPTRCLGMAITLFQISHH